MLRKNAIIIVTLILSMLVLTSCNLPEKQAIKPETPSVLNDMIVNTPTPAPSLCDNLYFPNSIGDTWDYSGNTSVTGAYTRTDTISNSSEQSFTVQSNVSGNTVAVDFSCSEAGLTAVNPIQQYMGAILTSLNAQVNINLVSNSGITLPKKISPGDSWQQIAEWDASAQDFSMNGRFVIEYTAVGFETVTVPSGTFDALRVDTTIRIEVSDFRILYGTFEITTWMAPNVGIVKNQGSSNVPNMNFTESMELSRFVPSP
jgi:hypothetical protein